MALSKYTKDTAVIANVGLDPEDRTDLDDDTFRAKWDENATDWKTFFNDTVSVEIDALITAIKGAGWTSESLKGLADLISTNTSNAKFYGKYTAVSGGSGASDSHIAFSNLIKDDLAMTNLATYPTRLTVPSGMSTLKISFKNIVMPPGLTSVQTFETSLTLYKNGVATNDMFLIKAVGSSSSNGEKRGVSFESSIIEAVAGDYFTVFISGSSLDYTKLSVEVIALK